MSDHVHALPAGYRLQEYEFVRVLGSGGFGITYLCFDHNLDQARAIKEYLPVDLASRAQGNTVQCNSTASLQDFEAGLESFLAEAKMLARFEHKNIVKVHRSFSENSTAYIVMEYAEGEPLDSILRQGKTLSEQELQDILLPIMDGLEMMHGHKVLHRDIKPGNIIIRDLDNSPALLDFGAARQAIESRSRSMTAIVTAGFAPFEQYSQHGNQGPWTDIYALGALACLALSGEKPPEAPLRMRNDPMTPISQRCAGKASPAFLKAIDWALAPYEEDRPQNIAQWRAAFDNEAAIGDSATSKHQDPDATGKITSPIAASTPAGPAPRRKKGLWIGMTLTLLILLGGSGLFALQQYPDIFGGGETLPPVEEIPPDTSGLTGIPRMVEIPAGSFVMGSEEGTGDSDEWPAHEVQIDTPFAIGATAVSVADYRLFAQASDKTLPTGEDELPVTQTSWQDAVDYADWLSEETSNTYRLPSEAEWEYVAQGGTLDNIQGDIWQWVQDCARNSYVDAPTDGSVWTADDEAESRCSRILRGGDSPRNTYRNWEPADTRRDDIGFRLVKEL